VYLPPDANCLLATAEHCYRSRNYVNLIVVDKQRHLQYLDLQEAREHCAAGASTWSWASSGENHPDVVLAAAGDVPTLETLAAAALLRERVPDLATRVVNVADLMSLMPPGVHPHGLAEERFEELFGESEEVVMAFHGYARAAHQLLHGRPHPGRFHVRGYNEQGTTTTPFDMVVLNRMSRYHLAMEAVRRSRRRPPGADELEDHCEAMLARHERHVREHLEDMPEIVDWSWPG
jgi:xylulose-5-phosphate/fructose-6-phosphate phosphoketolase